jgi:hypothetical protein
VSTGELLNKYKVSYANKNIAEEGKLLWLSVIIARIW